MNERINQLIVISLILIIIIIIIGFSPSPPITPALPDPLRLPQYILLPSALQHAYMYNVSVCLFNRQINVCFFFLVRITQK